jgi:tetratricopeptide (TPR) repeat protein
VDRLALTRLIRYGLTDLSARNGHHAFEEMCRFLAAARIASNVYPATGPVASGGDAGRDFQTFATYIQDELGSRGAFAALASGEPIAFACTLQTKSVPTKIRQDLKRIAAGPEVHKVYALIAADMPAAKAQELKTEARQQHEIELEILDGQALAEMLSHHDTFWMAARWLAVPAEYGPERFDTGAIEPAWYVESRERWRAAQHPPTTMGEVMEVRAGLRRATFHANARPDLSLWLAWMTQSCASEHAHHVRQRARYETAVAQLRGAGDLRPADDHVGAFLGDLDLEEATWAELMDASVLIQYVVGAALRGRTTYDVDWIAGWNRRLQEAIATRLRRKDLTPTENAGLLDVLGHLRCHTDLAATGVPDEPLEPYDPLDDRLGAHRTLKPIPASVVLIDADGAIEAWTKLARLAPKAPLLPIDSLSEILALLAPALVDRSGYRKLVDLMDRVLAEVAGSAAAAERSRDRATALLDENRPLEALTDLHEAKARWWRGDTLRGSLLALMLLAHCYEHLGLFPAARQQALVAVGLATAHGSDEDGDIIAAGLMRAAHVDYRSGAWCAAVESYSVAMMAHAVHAEDPWNVERHSDLQAAYLHGGYLRAVAACADQGLEEHVRRVQAESGLSEVLDEVEALIPQRSPDDWRDEIVEKLGTVPYADAGPDRVIQWSALGVSWRVQAVNTYAHSRAAERFAAAAQILCAELVQEELVLMPTTIRVRVQVSGMERTAGRDRVRRELGNEGSDWIVDLLPVPGNGADLDAEEVAKELTVALVAVLYEASLLRWELHKQIIEGCFERGLPHKLGAGRPYDDIASVVSRQRFDEMTRAGIKVPPAWRDFPLPVPASELAWRDGPGPGYSKTKSEDMIRNRYRRSREILSCTIPRLARDPVFRATYEDLLRAGWKDWHVLLALVNARLSFRLASQLRTPAQVRELAREQAQLPIETANDPPLPEQWLTIERLTQMRRLAFMTGARFWELEIHQDTPDLEAVEQVLAHRYGYWTDDIPHAPIFAASSEHPLPTSPSSSAAA